LAVAVFFIFFVVGKLVLLYFRLRDAASISPSYRLVMVALINRRKSTSGAIP